MNASAARPLSDTGRWGLVGLLMIYAALGHFNRVAISVAGSEVFIREYGLTKTEMGMVYTTLLVVYTICMLPGGWIVDRLGARYALTLLGLVMGTFVVLTGVLGWMNLSPYGLWIGLLLVRAPCGAGNAPLHPGAAHAVSDVMSSRRRATANGLVTAGALIGIAICYPVFGLLIDRLTWPVAFVTCGLVLMAFGGIWMVVVRSALPSPARSEEQLADPAAVASNWQDATTRAVEFMLRGRLWLLALSYGAFGYFQYLFFYWMEHYFNEVLEVPTDQSRELSFYITLAQGAGMAIGGASTDFICQKLGLVRGRRAIVMVGMGLSAVFGLAALGMGGASGVAWCLGCSMGALGICEGVFWTTATDLGRRSRGMGGAVMNTGGNIGGCISPWLTPYMAEQIGWNGSIAVACGVSLFGGLAWFWIKPPVPETASD